MVFLRIWQYDVAADREAEFERAYSADGDWARLFGRSDGYRGTELFKRVGQPLRYLTVDRFESATAWHEFLSEHGSAYAALDHVTEGMTLAEHQLSATERG
jgi:heme-degrading monooxygenase HmoA